MVPMERSQHLRTGTTVASALLALLIAFLGAEVGSYSRNTLLNHPEWVSGKLLLWHVPMGGYNGTGTRNLLQRNRLNLQEWFGFNEVLLNKVFAFGSLQCTFLLDEGAYLALLFNRTATSSCGVRLSRRVGVPSIYFRVDSDGRFLEKEPLGGITVAPGWHTAALRARPGGVELELDGRRVKRLPVAALEEQVMGVRSGRKKALVDDFVATDAAGRVVIDENFRNDKSAWLLRATLFVGAFLLLGLLLRLGRLRGIEEKQLLFRFLLGGQLLVLGVVAYGGFDLFFWSSRYPYDSYTPWQRGYRLSKVEGLRRTLFRPFALFDARDEQGDAISFHGPSSAKLRSFLGAAEPLQELGAEVFREEAGVEPFRQVDYRDDGMRKYLADSPLGSAYTILLVGTSQTRGSGAGSPETSLAGQICASLRAATARPVALFNAAISGSHSQELLRTLRLDLAPLKPDLVVVNLSHNDRQKPFAAALEEIAQVSRERGAQLVFVREAHSLEVSAAHLRKKHRILDGVAANAGIAVVNLFGNVAEREREDVGFLWWDQVHLTSFGQTLAAEAIAAGILMNFRSELLPNER